MLTDISTTLFFTPIGSTAFYLQLPLGTLDCWDGKPKWKKKKIPEVKIQATI